MKYPPIQGGVCIQSFWLAQWLAVSGHRVTVLTNAEEVEDEYKITLSEADKTLLSGYWKPNSIRVVSTTTNKRHVFIPRNNPFCEKMVALGLDIIAEDRPDFIMSHYFQPYGVVAMTLSMLSGIPYSVRNAGSDVGRLAKTELGSLYTEVVSRASAVFTTQRNNGFLHELGMNSRQLELYPANLRLPGDLFFPEDRPVAPDGQFRFVIFGKAGEAKGTPELIKLAKVLKQRGSPIGIDAYWSGRDLPKYKPMITEADVARVIRLKPLVPHWQIPEVIRSADAGLFLENRFKIAHHTPGVPAEINCCGRYIVTTGEIEAKAHVSGFLNDQNGIALSLDNLQDPTELAHALEKTAEKIQTSGHPPQTQCMDASQISRTGRKHLIDALNQIESIL